MKIKKVINGLIFLDFHNTEIGSTEDQLRNKWVTKNKNPNFMIKIYTMPD